MGAGASRRPRRPVCPAGSRSRPSCPSQAEGAGPRPRPPRSCRSAPDLESRDGWTLEPRPRRAWGAWGSRDTCRQRGEKQACRTGEGRGQGLRPSRRVLERYPQDHKAPKPRAYRRHRSTVEQACHPGSLRTPPWAPQLPGRLKSWLSLDRTRPASRTYYPTAALCEDSA